MAVELNNERGFEYSVSVNITLTADDLRLIKRASEMHYDYNCRTFFSDKKPAPGNYWRNMFTTRDDKNEIVDDLDPLDEKVPGDHVSDPIKVSFDDIDRVSKILEMTMNDRESNNAARGMSLRIQFKRVIIAIKDESQRLYDNRPDPVESAA
jgi:hypothetical protein